jgi:branched-chain amino acid transport system substrate-binding protein
VSSTRTAVEIDGAGRPKRGRVFIGIPLAAVILVAFLLVGCGGAGETTTGPSGLPKEIVIGAAIAKTGYLAPYDANIAAIEQLVKEKNAEGGIDGSKIRVVQADNHSEPQQAPTAARKVIEDGADVLLLSCEATTAAAAAPIAEEHDELNFTMCANEPGFGPPTTGHLSFSGSPSLLNEASARATFLHSKGIEHPFLLIDTSIILGKEDCGAFRQSWEHLGGTISGTAEFKNEDPSIATQIDQIKESGADAIMLCSYPPGGASAIKQIRAAGIEVPIAASAAFDGTFWLKGIPNLGTFYVTVNGSAYDPANRATAKLFSQLEKAGVNTDVSGTLLASYAAAQLIFAAIEETHSVDGEVLADALEARPHPTIVGNAAFTEDDHYPNRVWPVYEFVDGKPRFVTEVAPKFVPEPPG